MHSTSVHIHIYVDKYYVHDQECRKDFWSGPAVVSAHAIFIMNFIKSAKKWSSQNRTSWTGSYTYDDAHIHDIMYTYTVHVAERQRLSTVYVVFGRIGVFLLGMSKDSQQHLLSKLTAATSRPPNVCVSSPCANGGTCTPDSDSGSYTCHCPPGYTGPTCDTNIDECMAASCPVNSTCEDGVNTFRCVCNAGYEGPNCTETARNGQG